MKLFVQHQHAKIALGLMLAVGLLLGKEVSAVNLPSEGCNKLGTSTVICLGDSLTCGYTTKFKTADGTQKTCTVIAEVGRRVEAMKTKLEQFINANPTEIGNYTDIVVMGGTNNSAGGDSTNATKKLGEIYQLARQHNLKITAVTITPFGGYSTYNTEAEHNSIFPAITAINNFVRASGADHLVDEAPNMSLPGTYNASNPAASAGDPPEVRFPHLKPEYDNGAHLHYSSAGYTYLANKIAAAIGGTGTLATAPSTSSPAPASTTEADQSAIVQRLNSQITPRLIVPIPDFSFSEAQISEVTENGVVYQNIDAPYLAEYLAAIFRYAIAICGILATVLMMIGGFQYLVGQHKDGMARIKNSTMGMLLLFVTYVILQTVNRGLVEFNAVRVQVVRNVPFDSLEFDDKDFAVPTTESDFTIDVGGGAPLPPLAPNELDSLFKAYAACYTKDGRVLDWQLLKRIAQAESGLNPGAGENAKTGRKYMGLFAESFAYCNEGITKGKYPYLKCGDATNDQRTDPEVNVAAAAWAIDHNLQIIVSGCPKNTTLEEVLYLSYVAHNNGPGVMGFVVKNNGCAKEQQPIVVSQYYENQDAKDGKPGDLRVPCIYNSKKPSSCSPDGTKPMSVTPEYGIRKWAYGKKIAKAAPAGALSSDAYVALEAGVSCQRDKGVRFK